MSEVAIDALRVDLTRLLLSARSCGPAHGRPETDQIAQTTSLFRRCKQIGYTNAVSGRGSGGSGDVPETESSAGSITQRKSPLPEEVDSSCYTYASLADQQKSKIAADAAAKAASPARAARSASPGHGDVDRRTYTYADGFKPRRRHDTEASARYTFSRGGDFRFRRWHECRSVRNDGEAHSPCGQQTVRGSNPNPGTLKGISGDGLANGDAPPTGGGEGTPTESGLCTGDAWSEKAAEAGGGLRGQEEVVAGPTERRVFSAAAAAVSRGGTKVPPHRKDSSELHEFLYREGRSREDRLRAKQMERDRELTFQPRLATNKYWRAAAARRRRRALAEVSEGGADGTGAEEPAGRQASAPWVSAAAGVVGVGGVGQTRFEILYQDSKAQLLRAQEDSLKIPAEYTFQPRLISSRGSSPRGRSRHNPSATAAGCMNVGGEAYTLGNSAELMPEAGPEESYENEDDSQGWVNTLVFGVGDDSNESHGRGRGEQVHPRQRLQEPEQDQQQQRQQQQDLREHHHRFHSRSASGSIQEDDDGESSGGGAVVCRRAGGRIGREERRRSKSLPARRGLSEGTGQRGRAAAAAAVGTTLSYPERLYRGHEEQHQVWAKRQEESARLELKGCTFRPRLKQQSQHRDRVSMPSRFREEQHGAGRRRKSSSAVQGTAQYGDGDPPPAVSASPVAAHERLYQAAELARARRAEEAAERKRAETVGCTFQPAVNRAGGAAAVVVAVDRQERRRRSTHPEEVASPNGMHRSGNRGGGDCYRNSHSRPNKNNNKGSNSSNGGSGHCVFDRLFLAGKEADRRKAIRGKVTPPGCTFRPQVNLYAHKKRLEHPDIGSKGSANGSDGGGCSAAALPPPPPQEPPFHPYRNLQGDEDVGEVPPPPPLTDSFYISRASARAGWRATNGDEAVRGSGHRPTAAVAAAAAQSGESGDATGSSGGCSGSGGGGSSGSSAERSGPLAGAAAFIAAEINETGCRIPYLESKFSPRRGRRTVERAVGGEDGGGGGGAACEHESPACDRLYELGYRAQRKRNEPIRDALKAQREREELEELKLCTFAPVIFTKADRRPRPTTGRRGGKPAPNMEEDGFVS